MVADKGCVGDAGAACAEGTDSVRIDGVVCAGLLVLLLVLLFALVALLFAAPTGGEEEGDARGVLARFSGMVRADAEWFFSKAIRLPDCGFA